jgi:peptidoglycan/xylan/chitin deacetylase (PgdA/CDA1 family)
MTGAAIKNVLGRTMLASGFDRILLANTAIVVVFHRIAEAPEWDSLSVGVKTFARYCEFFARHFRVVPLGEIVDRLADGRCLDRQLAITFDDGYRDNFENAAPILERLALPATFFVVSDWIGTAVIPWWDRQQGFRHPLMTWEQIRTLHQRGFEIGGHTRTHADLGSLSGDRATEEISGARRELQERLGTTVDLFALPYGHPDNLADANRALVKAAGFRCCCWCSGGVNPGGTDPFQLARIPISGWYASPAQFAFEAAVGWSVESASNPCAAQVPEDHCAA